MTDVAGVTDRHFRSHNPKVTGLNPGLRGQRPVGNPVTAAVLLHIGRELRRQILYGDVALQMHVGAKKVGTWARGNGLPWTANQKTCTLYAAPASVRTRSCHPLGDARHLEDCTGLPVSQPGAASRSPEGSPITPPSRWQPGLRRRVADRPARRPSRRPIKQPCMINQVMDPIHLQHIHQSRLQLLNPPGAQ